ncbi:MAG: PHP domain-containing protein [Clostridia bacterium]|nr:PHP domain-containing protein [Clostridia bacterium]
MPKFYYDLHMHSCLSPCADDDMTPASAAGIAALNGLSIAALTDHNSCGNLPAFFGACRAYGVTPIAGMELETAESVHIICLFPELSDAMKFWQTVRENYMMPFKNDVSVFGGQFYVNEEDEVTGTEEILLIASTTLSLDEGVALAREHGGFVFPSHIDRTSNGIIAILGDIPPEPGFTFAEFNDGANVAAYREKYASVAPLGILVNSDAHHLTDINEAENFIELDADPSDEDSVRKAFFAFLNKNK